MVRARGSAWFIVAGLVLAHAAGAGAQPAPDTQNAPRMRWRVEMKNHFRASRDVRVPLLFPFPPDFIPAGQSQVFEQTVIAGPSAEISSVGVSAEAVLSPAVEAKADVRLFDLYNRNPTTSDDVIAIREAWLRWGRKSRAAGGDPSALYAQLGMAPRFSRPASRLLESYGLWSTAVGRFEEIGIELGGQIEPRVYWRALVSNGNPMFFRDTNALAGDNGTPQSAPPGPDPVLHTGFPILYDAKAQDIGFGGAPMLGAGVGARWGAPATAGGCDVLAWYFRRDMEDRARIRGTFYQGDLELLHGAGIPAPARGREKWETGVNITARRGHVRGFGQYVVQRIAGLERRGGEIEAGARFDLGGLFVTGDEPVLNWIEPAVRVSVIDNRFTVPAQFVAPSIAWDWTKVDAGVRIGILRGTDFTAEYSFHRIDSPRRPRPDEFLATLRTAF